ncbi:MAG: hypothetical protein AB7W37_11145 [Syntrophobacteraceae bacterium]
MSRQVTSTFLMYLTLTVMIAGPAHAVRTVPSQEGAVQSQGTTGQTQTTETVSVLNVLVEKIDGNVLYAKDGSTYPLSGLTVVDNSKKGKVYVAELTYIGGTLKRVMLK